MLSNVVLTTSLGGMEALVSPESELTENSSERELQRGSCDMYQCQ